MRFIKDLNMQESFKIYIQVINEMTLEEYHTQLKLLI